MSDWIIKAEGLGKKYRIKHQAEQPTGPSAQPDKPSVRSAKPNRKRWSKTG